MLERDKFILWDSGEVIYRAGDPSQEAFLIMEGSVELFTAEGLRLNRIGANEILGETSLLLDTERTVTAIASTVGAKATRIPRQYFADLSKRDKVAAALVRKIQFRLIDSNKQSNMLGLEIENIAALVEELIQQDSSDSGMIARLRGKLDTVRQQVVIDRHLAGYPNSRANAAENEENAENFG
ncbi:MAG: cyclic nucleotide-binding domain-containing protein [Rhodobiaceae bacterium]